jgi:hypothetical protein
MITRRVRVDDETGLKTVDLTAVDHCGREHHLRCAPTIKEAVYWIECDCGERGPESPHERGAIEEWNEKFGKKSKIRN